MDKITPSVKVLIFIVLMAFVPNYLNGQVFSSGKPFFNPQTDTFKVPDVFIKLTQEQNLSLKKSDNLLKDDLFAIPMNVSISPDKDGVWIHLPEQGKKIWLISLTVEQAKSLNLILEPFRLKEGAKLFFYNETQSKILGAITSRNNRPYGILPLAIIEGNRIYCELQVSENEDFGYFTISKMGVEINESSNLKSTNDRWFSKSDTCHVNVNCFPYNHVQTQKNSACRIVFGGTRRCTGTLLNNLTHDRSPYVLTAGHCFNTEYMANTAVYYFNYESPSCQSEDGSMYSISGSTLLAAGFHVSGQYDSLDFALVKLSESIPAHYSPHYSGWDATGRIPDSSSIYHHPEGDVMKISIDRNPLSYSQVTSGFESNTFWKIVTYEEGSTEDGSSGTGLIDEYSRLVGTLSGGNQACSEYMNDFFQMFKYSYNFYEDSTYQLKHWLDPYNYGSLICESYNSHVGLLFTADRLYNFNQSDSALEVKNQYGWGYISGHNDKKTKEYVEKYIINGSKYLLGALIDPAAIYGSNSFQEVNFMLWEGTDMPENIVYEKSFTTEDMMKAYQEIGDSLFWVDFDSSLLVSNNFYFGYTIEYSADTFALKVYPTDGNANTAFVKSNKTWIPLQKDGEDYPAHLAIKLLYSDFMPKKGKVVEEDEIQEIFIYPNPVRDQIQVFIKQEFEGDVNCIVYDLAGRPVFTEKFSNPGRNIPLLINLETGVYILKVLINNTSTGTFKILVE